MRSLDVLDHPGRVADDDGPRRDVVDHDRAGPHESVLSDDHARQDGHVGADAGQTAHHGAALAVFVARTVHGVRIVGEDGVGAHEHVVFDGHHLEEAAGVDAHPAADAVAELQDGIGANGDVVAHDVVFADAGALAGLQAIAEGAAGIDGREGANDGSRSR